MTKKTCIIVSGPTAVGKTSYGIELARKYQTEIISADSRQCYKELNIGVAKPSQEDLAGVRHFFINSHSIHDEVNTKIFEEYALKSVNEIFRRNDVAVMVGGTGLYIQAFAQGLDDVPQVRESIRNEVNELYDRSGIDWLREKIMKEDPVYLIKGEMENPQRMLRALEVKLETGKSIFDFHSGNKVKRDFEITHIELELPREILYERINSRVDLLMEKGLLEEAKSLFQFRHLNALQTVGYKELFDYFLGKIPLEEAVLLIKKNTRNFAKRQITWFKGHR